MAVSRPTFVAPRALPVVPAEAWLVAGVLGAAVFGIAALYGNAAAFGCAAVGSPAAGVAFYEQNGRAQV